MFRHLWSRFDSDLRMSFGLILFYFCKQLIVISLTKYDLIPANNRLYLQKILMRTRSFVGKRPCRRVFHLSIGTMQNSFLKLDTFLFVFHMVP